MLTIALVMRCRTIVDMGPDLSRGQGYGNPEQRSELLKMHQEEMAEQIEQDREAKRARDAESAGGRKTHWWTRWLHR